MKGYARFEDILKAGYFFNGLSILDAEIANIVPLWRYLYGRDEC